MQVLTLVIFFFICLSSISQEGMPDLSFGNNGKAFYTPNGFSYDSGTDMAVQADGKILMVGNIHNGSFYDYLLVRINKNGTIDNSFNGTGQVTISVSDRNDFQGAITIQKDGKIIVVGSSEQPVNNSYKNGFAVIRVNPDGSLDNSFNGNGKVLTLFDNTHAHAASVILQPDGKIIVGGDIDKVTGGVGGVNFDFAIARYLPNGLLDNSFNGDGKVTTTIDNINNERIFSLALQPDGKIVGAGLASRNNPGNGTQFAVVRYHSNGTLDSSFNGNGIITHGSAQGFETARSVIIQGNKKILITGQSTETAGLKLIRYNADGTPDNDFGIGGVAILNIGNCSGWKLLLQADKKVIVAGSIIDANISKFLALRVKENGVLDDTFGQDGKLITATGETGYARTAAFQENKILIGGKSFNEIGLWTYSVVRLNNSSGPTPAGLKDIIVYPNPAPGSVYLKFLGYSEIVLITLFDAIGRRIKVQKNAVVNQSIVDMQVEPLPKAVYEIVIQTSEGKVVKRFIKL